MTQQTHHILFVEDESGHIQLARRGFAHVTDMYRLTVATTITEANSILNLEIVDLVIADLILPDGRGTDLLSVANEDLSVPLVILTSHGDEHAAVEAMKHGALDYVVKSASLLLDLPRVASRAMRQWQDVVARKKAEQELRDSEQRFRRIVETAQEGIWTVDADGVPTFVNSRMTKMLGYETTELMEYPMLLIPRQFESEGPGSHDCRSGLIHRESTKEHCEACFQRKDGTRLWTLLSTNSILDDHGQCVGTLAMITDITEKKRAAEELNERESQLAHVARLSTLGEMVAWIAHEINQPLYAITNFSQACINLLDRQNPLDTEKLRRWIERIQKSAGRSGDIIKSLRGLTANKLPAKIPTDINKVVANTVEMISFEARRRDVSVELELMHSNQAISVDNVAIQQVVTNLLRNAYEACDELEPGAERHVTIRTSRDDESIQVTVEDNGPGFSQDSVESIFNPFYTTKSDGMGMGLAISETIIKAHGGSLQAVPKPHGGASFRFNLPVKPRPETRE